MTYTATYSPEDNKLRLFSSTRLDRELYARVRGAGFIYAPKQELFVAPMWTPEREDLLIELCGEIDDEDTSLVERAEVRADRFADYKDKRISDAERAQEAVSRIVDNIPLGQPILIGHHSERHARKDAERIENGMRKTVKMWHTAKYWEDRAKGALRHAKYKVLPGVRHRRIKGLEADLRRYQNSFTPAPKTKPQMWDGEEHVWITNGSRGGRWAKSRSLPAIEQQSRRWIEHLQNRIAYEKAMLGEAGGIAAAQFTIEVGGRVLVADEWVVVLKLNRVGGTLNSVSTTPLRHWHGSSTKVEIERVKDYRAPGPGDTEKVKAATKLPPALQLPRRGIRPDDTGRMGQEAQGLQDHSRRRCDRNPCAASGSYARVLELARAAGDQQAITALTTIGPPPWHSVSKWPIFRKWEKAYQAKVVTAPPAPETLSPAYASPEERAQYEAADDFNFMHFWGLTLSGPLTEVDLPALGTKFAVPIFIIQGQEDLTAVPELAKAYFDSIKAPLKHFYLVPGTGHEPSATELDLTLKVLVEQVRPLAVDRLDDQGNRARRGRARCC